MWWRPIRSYFFDGLHQFEQTARDILNGIWLSHRRTIWIIDDVFPSDPYSACRDQGRAYSLRDRAGLRSRAWHGDVFKVVFFIHDFLPNLNYCTLRDGGNPQTVVWCEYRQNATPVCGSLEDISRLSYFDLMDSLTVLHLTSEAEAYEKVREAIG